MNILGILTSIATALFSMNAAADISERVIEGQGRRLRKKAASRIHLPPVRAAKWLQKGLRDGGHKATVRPGLVGSGWVLIAYYPEAPTVQPPDKFEGYSVQVQTSDGGKPQKRRKSTIEEVRKSARR